jgi:aspartokinase
MKFGGTSVGIPEHFQAAVRLVADRVRHDPVVVVSALSEVTNLLVDFCRRSAGRAELAERFAERHLAHADATGIARDRVEPILQAWRAEAGSHVPRRDALADEARDRVL